MAPRKFLQVTLIELLGFFQGLAISSIPAASNLLTGSHYQKLSAQEYGILFLPLIIGSIIFSTWGGIFARKKGLKPLLVIGVIGNIAAMEFFSTTNLTLHSHGTTYFLLLLSMFFLGMSFGSIVTTLSTLMGELFPIKTATAMTALHASFGIGTAVSPLLINVGIDVAHWWIAPEIISLGFLILLIFVHSIKFPEILQTKKKQTPLRGLLPLSIGLFFLSTFLYGFCETAIGNWSPIYLKKIKLLSVVQANQALSAFWAAVTVGRIIISVLANRISFRYFYVILPLFLALFLFLFAKIQGAENNLLFLALLGFGCSALLPLNFSFGQQSFPEIKSVTSGFLMTAYMLGYGAGSYGLGELIAFDIVTLGRIFTVTAVVAILLALFHFINNFVFRETPSAEQH